MKKIALLSITLNAVNPMTNYLLSKPDITVVNYLDSYLSEKIKRDGAINDDSMGRLLQMLALACRDGADGIILTCTVFSPYVESVSKFVFCAGHWCRYCNVRCSRQTWGKYSTIVHV